MEPARLETRGAATHCACYRLRSDLQDRPFSNEHRSKTRRAVPLHEAPTRPAAHFRSQSDEKAGSLKFRLKELEVRIRGDVGMKTRKMRRRVRHVPFALCRRV